MAGVRQLDERQVPDNALELFWQVGTRHLEEPIRTAIQDLLDEIEAAVYERLARPDATATVPPLRCHIDDAA